MQDNTLENLLLDGIKESSSWEYTLSIIQEYSLRLTYIDISMSQEVIHTK